MDDLLLVEVERGDLVTPDLARDLDLDPLPRDVVGESACGQEKADRVEVAAEGGPVERA